MRAAVLTTPVWLCTVSLSVADDARVSVKKFTDIPPQELWSALQALAKDRNLQVIYISEEVQSLRTGGASGDLTPDEALEQLLKGTGLAYSYLDDTTITVFPARPGPSSRDKAPVSPSSIGAKDADRLHLAHSTQEHAIARRSPGGQDTQTLEGIIVTARKRTERAQEVPASISVLAGTQLESLHARQLTDYAAYVPGLQVDSYGAPGRTQLTLRGIAADPFAGATVGTYIDDTPAGSSSLFAQGSSFQLDLMPYDIERVEVLRGPQGTLYGASAMGGLLKYVTRLPQLDAFEIRAGAEALSIHGGGSLGWSGRGSINIPLIEDKLALRGSAFDTHTPGYIDNALTGRDDENAVRQVGGRAALLWQPTDELSLKLSALFQNIDAAAASLVTTGFVPRGPTGVDVAAPTYGDLAGGHRASTAFLQRLQFYTATINYDLGWAGLTSATSYSRSNSQIHSDLSASFGEQFPLLCPQVPGCSAVNGGLAPGVAPLFTPLALKKITQEFRLASPGGRRLDWLLGAFYTDEDVTQNTQLGAQDRRGRSIPLLDPLALISEPSRYREYAVFGDATYRFTDRLDFTAGLRWAHNEQHSGHTISGNLGVASFGASSSESVLTYMASPRFHVSPDVMIYGRVASGYRPGGANPAIPGIPSKVDADTLINYELGVKAELAGHRALIDVAIFHIDWRDIQVGGVSSGGFNFNTNAGSAKSQGVELTSVVSPAVGLRLGLTAAYTDAQLTADIPLLGGLSGDQLALMPRWNASATASYEWSPVGQWTAQVSGGYRYVADRYSQTESNPTSARLRAYDSFDLSLRLSNERLTLAAFAKNLADERAYLTSFTARAGNTLAIGILQPRTVGVSADVRF
jgi:iron complex outermembrane recepter protein